VGSSRSGWLCATANDIWIRIDNKSVFPNVAYTLLDAWTEKGVEWLKSGTFGSQSGNSHAFNSVAVLLDAFGAMERRSIKELCPDE
jgi:hypothetical protein